MSSRVHALLDRLDCVRQAGHDRWIARCPAHEDRRPSLSIREAETGTTLIYCFGGCDVASIVAAIDLQLSDLFPPRLPGLHSALPRASRLTPLIATFEQDLILVQLFLSDIANGTPICDADREAASAAAGRIWTALQNARYVL